MSPSPSQRGEAPQKEKPKNIFDLTKKAKQDDKEKVHRHAASAHTGIAPWHACTAALARPPPSPRATDRCLPLGCSPAQKSFKVKELVKVGLEGLSLDPPAVLVRGPSGRQYGSRAFGCLRPATAPRKQAILFLENGCFEPLIIFTILLNCVTMAWESPVDPPGTWKAHFIDDILEPIYLGVYTFEMLVKMTAYGLWHGPSPYLRDPWCQLDFVVVTFAWLPILTPLSVANMSFVRTLRALRPLRALKGLPGMPALVQSILYSLPKLGNVVGLCGFLFLLFGIVGMELFKGSLHYRCATEGFDARALARDAAFARGLPSPFGSDDQAAYDSSVACHPQSADACEVLALEDPSLILEGCRYFDSSMADGLLSFDSVPITQIILMQIITFDDWATSMYTLPHRRALATAHARPSPLP